MVAKKRAVGEGGHGSSAAAGHWGSRSRGGDLRSPATTVVESWAGRPPCSVLGGTLGVWINPGCQSLGPLCLCTE